MPGRSLIIVPSLMLVCLAYPTTIIPNSYSSSSRLLPTYLPTLFYNLVSFITTFLLRIWSISLPIQLKSGRSGWTQRAWMLRAQKMTMRNWYLETETFSSIIWGDWKLVYIFIVWSEDIYRLNVSVTEISDKTEGLQQKVDSCHYMVHHPWAKGISFKTKISTLPWHYITNYFVILSELVREGH